MKKKIFSVSLIVSAFLVGCGSTGEDNTSSVPLILSVLASDAYVVKLKTPATLKIGDKEYNTTDVEKGKIKFKVPKDINLSQDVKVSIPRDAIVDSNNNGKWDENDSKIRMPLETNSIGDGYVANPLTTVALETNNTDLLEKVKTFDPVEAKRELILNSDDNQTKVLVAASDGIAILSQKVEEKGKDPLVAMKEINTSAIEEAYKNPSDMNITNVLNKALSPAANYVGVDLSNVIDKVNGIMKVIDKASISIKNIKGNGNTINVGEVADAYTSLVISTSDGNVTPDNVVNNFNSIENNILNPNGTSNVQNIINQLETNTSKCNNVSFPPAPPQIDINNSEVNNSIVYPPVPPQIPNN
jgi:hypothetical protein